MRDPRTLAPYQPQRLPSILDYLDEGSAPAVAAPAMAQAAQPQPSVASRLVGAIGGGLGAVAQLPFLIPQAAAARLQERIGESRAAPQMRALEMEHARLANEAAQRQAQLEAAQLPAQQAAAAAQAREQSTLTDRIGQAQDPRLRDSLIRGAATGTFKPFEVEPGPAELAAYQSVLGMKEEDAKQKLMAQREQRQAQLEAGLQRETNTQRFAGELDLERQKRALGPEPVSIGEKRQLRQEFEGLGKEFGTVRNAYKLIRALPDTKVGDLTLLISYMKLTDPGSTVREGELATADNAGGVPGQLRAVYNRFVSGEGRLAPEIRQDFLARADDLYNARLSSHRNLERQYGDIATRAGIDPKDVVTDLVGPDDAPKAPRKTFAGHEYEKVDGGWKLVQ